MDESDEIHDARELDRLVRFMTRKGRRFGLALATYADAEVAAEQRASAFARADAAEIQVTTIIPRNIEGDPIARLQEASAGNDVLFLIGLDEIAFDRAGDNVVTRVLTNLNLRRDELPQHIDARVVVWIAAEAYAQLAKIAWDLVDVMLTRFEFRRARPPQPRQRSLTWREGFPDWPSPSGLLQSSGETEAASYAQLAGSSEDELTAADASATAGELYSSYGRLDLGKRWLERAADIYERKSETDGNLTVAATRIRLQLARVLAADGQVDSARAQARRALAIVDRAVTPGELSSARLGRERVRLSCLLTLWHLGDTISAGDHRWDDHDLLERWRVGDTDAIRTLFVRYIDFIEEHLNLMVPESHWSDEFAIDVFAALFLHQPQLHIQDFRAFLFRAARAIANRFDTPLPSARRPPVLQPSLQSLPSDARALIEMHYVFGVPVEELAEMYGVVEPTMHWRLASAVQKLIDVHAERTGVRLSEPAFRAAFHPSATEPKP